MDIWRLLSAIIRRWYIIIPLLVATFAAAATIGSWAKPEYKTSAIISVVPSRATIQPQTVQPLAVQPQVTNPYLSLTYTAGVLQYELSSSNVQRDLVAAGLSGGYEIKAIPRTSFIGIGVTASGPDLAIATGRGVIARARLILAKRQSSIPASAPRVSIDVIDDADDVSASVSGQLQALAAVLAGGGIVSVVLTVLIDDLLLMRRRRRDRVMEGEVAPSNMVGAATQSSNAASEGTLNGHSTVDQDTERPPPPDVVKPSSQARG